MVTGFLAPINKIEAVPCQYTDRAGNNVPFGCTGLPPSQQPGNNIVENIANKEGGIIGWVTSGLSAALSTILYLILTIAALLLYIGGTLLDFVLKWTILDMKQNLDALTGINIAWKLIKDLMNIAFIFLLVYEGIKLIIGQGSKEKIKTFIAMIVLAALLVNFSLFFTKVLIDASNIVTIGFYNSIITSASDIQVGVGPLKTTISGISVPFMHNLGLADFWSSRSFEQMKLTTGGDSSLIIFPLMGIILFVIVSFVFFAISMVFIVRYLVLIILLILSPVAYMGMALNGVKDYANKWWEALNSQLLFAPIYMVMTWVTLKLMGTGGFIVMGGWGSLVGGDAAAGAVGTQTPISLVFNFIIIIGLIIASLVIAKSTSEKGSGYIKDYVGKLTTTAGNVAMGGTAAIGRRTFGAAASRLAEDQRLQNWAGRSFIGEKVLNTTRRVGSGSLDIRRSAAGEKVSDTLGVNFGKGTIFNENAGKGGFTQTVADKAKSQQDYAATLRGDQAKRDYAIRKSDKFYVRQGSRSNRGTLFGTMGRGNRIGSARILRAQVDPLETTLGNLNNNLGNQQNRDTQLNQQLSSLNNELNTLTAMPNRNAQQNNRLQQLNGPAGTGGSILNLQAQIAANATNIGNTQAQIAVIQPQINTLNGEINRLGLNNPNNPAALTAQQQAQHNAAVAAAVAAGTPPPPPPVGRPTRADEQNF